MIGYLLMKCEECSDKWEADAMRWPVGLFKTIVEVMDYVKANSVRYQYEVYFFNGVEFERVIRYKKRFD